jgi:membrane protein DedA with SNARE-associated domain/membrane-associated phospholipid phosphatase
MFEYLLKSIGAYMQANQSMGALIAGLIACAESMAIVGTIVPGSVTMTLIGTMIGSGVLDIKTTFTYVLVGAFIGDYLSYWVGYHYRDNIKQFKVMQRYVHWIDYGEEFIKKYGVMSIIIGRFFGPMRSMIPLVAGVLGMTRTKFILGAVPSVALWAVIYLTPGILLGAFALEMPTEIALKFVAIVVLLLATIILASMIIKKLFRFINNNQTKFASSLWLWLQRKPNWVTNNFFHCDKLGPTQVLKSVYALILFIICISIVAIILSSTVVNIYDLDVFNLMKNSYVGTTYKFFTVITFMGDKHIIIPSVIVLSLYLFYKNELRLPKYLLGITFVTSSIVWLTKYYVMRPRPILSSTFTEPYSFPSGHVALSTAVFTFLAFVLCHHLKPYKRSLIYKSLTCLIVFISFSRIYICAHWLSDVIFALALGLIVSLISSILYHRIPCQTKSNIKSILTIFLGSYCIFYTVYTVINYNNYVNSYDPPYFHQRSINYNQWWGKISETDIYRDNKLGTPVFPLNIQWLGQKEDIDDFLLKNKWHMHKPQQSIIYRLVHLVDEPNIHVLPLIPQTYNQRTPEIVFSKDIDNKQVVIKLWRSFLNIMPNKHKLWIGSIYKNPVPEKLFVIPSRYKPNTLNTVEVIDLYKKYLNINTIDMSNIISNTSIPTNIIKSDWDKKIIQIQFKKDKNDGK